jgi:hypothetical protein
MTMYVELLTTSLDSDRASTISGDGLFETAIACRNRMLGSRVQTGNCGSAQRLAYEIAYDRALINLSAASGIDVGPERFAHPPEERTRLEQALAEEGVYLSAAGLPRYGGAY